MIRPRLSSSISDEVLQPGRGLLVPFTLAICGFVLVDLIVWTVAETPGRTEADVWGLALLICCTALTWVRLEAAAWTAVGGSFVLAIVSGISVPGWLLPLVFLAMLATCVGRRHSRVYLLAVLVLGIPYSIADYGIFEHALWFMLTFLIPGFIAYSVGRGFRRSRLERRRQERKAVEQEASRSRALQDQRQQIARDLHDIVAHDLTVISMHAQALDADSADPLTRSALETIGASSSRALQDLRRLLDVLDDAALAADGDAEAAVICLEDELDRCVGTLRSLGFRVEITVQGSSEDLPQPLQSALCRVLQECTTNVIKHGAAARDGDGGRRAGPDCCILLDTSPAQVTLSVRNRVPQGTRPVGDGGLGLISMADRVSPLGGTFRAGLAADGMWEARAEGLRTCSYES